MLIFFLNLVLLSPGFYKLIIFSLTQVTDDHLQSSASLLSSANNWELLKQKHNFLLAVCVNEEGLKHT